ncbi:hypothetical protein P885DRAFT_71888 [Corynascus similis CBS 632.67]
MLGDKDYHIGDEARTALQTKVGVRFLLRAKLKAEFRHSSDVIHWAQDLSEKDSQSKFSQNLNQPIHEIIKQANNYHVIRSKRLDGMVVSEYKHLQECDNGPWPRIERSKDGTRVSDEPEGWDWKQG